jgi:uncharacterized membrane protein
MPASQSGGTTWRDDQPAVALIAAWFVLYGWRAVVGYLSLATQGYDLSRFDWALWSSMHGHLGAVPFMGHSIFSHHAMPVLFILLPVYAVFQSPLFLVFLQFAAFAFAAWLFYRLERHMGLERNLALVLLVVFLVSRRTHGAAVSVFYPESFQPGLAFGFVLAWLTARWGWYWVLAIVFLATKEDAAIYLGSFAAIQLLRGGPARKTAAATLGLAVVWFVLALAVVIPLSRAADGLSTTNPLIEARFAGERGSIAVGTLASRATTGAITRGFEIMMGVGLLPLAGWEWLAAAAPGIIVNMAATPDSQQAALIGHYFWPVLPWIFLAAAAGAIRIQRTSRRAIRVWLGVLLIGTVVDSPAFRHLGTLWVPARASLARAQLRSLSIAPGSIVLAQANLLPHLPHTVKLAVLRPPPEPAGPPDLVLMSDVGDQWPFNPEQFDRLLHTYQGDPGYQMLSGGPLYAFASRRGRK